MNSSNIYPLMTFIPSQSVRTLSKELIHCFTSSLGNESRRIPPDISEDVAGREDNRSSGSKYGESFQLYFHFFFN